MNIHRTLLCCVFLLGWTAMVWAMDHVTFRRGGREMSESGRLLITAQDGGLLLLARDGVIWPIPPDELIKHTSATTPLSSLHPRGNSKRLLADIAQEFQGLAHHALFDLLRHFRRLTPSGADRFSSGCTWRLPIIGRTRDSS